MAFSSCFSFFNGPPSRFAKSGTFAVKLELKESFLLLQRFLAWKGLPKVVLLPMSAFAAFSWRFCGVFVAFSWRFRRVFVAFLCVFVAFLWRFRGVFNVFS